MNASVEFLTHVVSINLFWETTKKADNLMRSTRTGCILFVASDNQNLNKLPQKNEVTYSILQIDVRF